MDNMDDPETTAKISDSAYSNSCSNSQSRRSHSSKSTHSGSNSSGSSGYGGKASTSGSSNTLGQPPKKEKESKKKKLSQTEVKAAEIVPADEPIKLPEPVPILATPNEKSDDVVESSMVIALPEQVAKEIDTNTTDIAISKEEALCLQPSSNAENFVTSRPSSNSSDGFSCVISMHDGVVMYASASITATLGFPKDIWIGRSFIDFVHPKDYKTFASLITNGLAFPKLENGKVDKGKVDKGQGLTSGSKMVCRIRRYRSLNKAFGVKDAHMAFMPFLLKFFFKDHSEDDIKDIYLVIQATPFLSAFKIANELLSKPVIFMIRHTANGSVEYIDPESVPYLGYLPQEIQEKNAIDLYHPDDLPYLKQVYENIVREGSVSSCRSYRIIIQSGDYIRVETEWSSVINPWSMKLEFVIAKHHIIEGPTNPDVFHSPEAQRGLRINQAENYRIQTLRDSIIRVMNEVRTKPAEVAKQQMGKRCQDLASFMETLIEETPKQEEELRLDLQELPERDYSYYERDSVMLGGISPHHDSDSKSSTDTPLSYNQLNYNENLQRYFDSQEDEDIENCWNMDVDNDPGHKAPTKPSSSFSSFARNSNESSNSSTLARYVSSPGFATSDYHYHRLTESTIHRHNVEMERELVKNHRDTRSTKGERERASNESRKKIKEHLARCNASFRPTSAGDASEKREQRGTKRPSKPQYNDAHARKHHCPSPREQYSRPTMPTATLSPPTKPSCSTSTTVAATQWTQAQHLNSFNILGVPHPVQMMTHVPNIPMASDGQALPKTGAAATGVAAMPGTSADAYIPSMPGSSSGPIPSTSGRDHMSGTTGMGPMPCNSMPPGQGMPAPYAMPHMAGPASMPAIPVIPGMAGMYPVYYGTPGVATPSTSKQQGFPSTSGYQPYQAPVPYMVHGHPISMVYGQPVVYSAVNPQIYPMQQQNHLMPQQMHLHAGSYEPLGLAAGNFAQSTEPATHSSYTSQDEKSKARTSDDNADKTDGESSYSSFYSSFFKTDSGSADDSGDQKPNPNSAKNRFWTKNMTGNDAMSFQSSTECETNNRGPNKKLARRKMEAPWNEQVNLTSELIYKYQMVTKPAQEILETDKKKIEAMTQSPLVNEQLGQLYLDLQLQGVAARLTLEEGITSSSSSGEENTPMTSKTQRKREFSKLTIIHEENAPMPAPNSGLLAPEESNTDATPSSMNKP